MAQLENTSEVMPAVGTVENLARPIKLTGVKLSGVSVTAALPGTTVSIAQRMTLTSEDAGFHKIAEGLTGAISHLSMEAGRPISLANANSVLLVIHADDTADLWVDTVAMSLLIISKRDLAAGMPVFSTDVGDVLGINFPAVEFATSDRVIFLFRQNWRFGLCFKLDEKPFDAQEFSHSLGFLYRGMAFRHLYDALANEATFGVLIDAGWFPFVEIVPADVSTLIDHCDAGFPLHIAEAELLTKFDQVRMDHILQRWMAKPAFAQKKRIFESAIRAFCNEDPVSCIKIIMTEIEGVLNSAYKEVHGIGTRKLTKLLAFAAAMAERRVGGPGTLLFPVEFVRYLQEYTYANFDAANSTDSMGSRHAIGHGAADDEAYTQTRALQAVLTLDQLFFYI